MASMDQDACLDRWKAMLRNSNMRMYTVEQSNACTLTQSGNQVLFFLMGADSWQSDRGEWRRLANDEQFH